MFYKWSRLNWYQENIIDNIRNDWFDLLNSPNKKEEIYHQFISENAGVFFYNTMFPRFVVLSKPKLGSDYIPDFVYFQDMKSLGTNIHIIELELPNTSPYTKANIPSSRLMGAVQQIQNWKDWIKNNLHEAKNIFPAIDIRHPNLVSFNYSVIIGRRDDNSKRLNYRNNLASELGIYIRSFDSLTDHLDELDFTDTMHVGSSQFDDIPTKEVNTLSNPFFQATPFSKWKEMSRKFGSVHPYGYAWKEILMSRQYSKHFDVFKEHYIDKNINPILENSLRRRYFEKKERQES